MGTDLPSANFMPGVVNERQAIKALEGKPMRSYITWQSSTPAFPHGVIITYSNTVKRDVKTHQRLARSDLGVWMPLSQSEHRVFPTVRHLLATRKYIDGTFKMPSSKEDVPSVPGEPASSAPMCPIIPCTIVLGAACRSTSALRRGAKLDVRH